MMQRLDPQTEHQPAAGSHIQTSPHIQTRPISQAADPAQARPAIQAAAHTGTAPTLQATAHTGTSLTLQAAARTGTDPTLQAASLDMAIDISPAQRDFLVAQLLHKRQVLIALAMLLVLLLALWELAAQFFWIDSFIFSSPTAIFCYFCSMARDGSLFIHTGITLLETVISFFLVIGISLASALLLWACRALSEVLEPYLVMLNSLPKSAMAPLLIVWLGNDMKTIVVAAVSVALFGSILTLHTGFSQTDPDKVKLIYSLGGTKWDVLTKVLLPSSVPMIVSSMKVNIGLCLVGVIIGEFLSSRAGLGYLITYGSQTFSCEDILI